MILKKSVSVVLIVISLCVLLFSISVFAEKQHSLSPNGLALIKEFEGFYSKAYWDYKHWSIGYGTYCEENEYPNGITEAEASALLMAKIPSYEKYLDAFLEKYSIKVNQNQYDALVSFTYNLGGGIWTTDKYDEWDLKTYLIQGVSKYTNQQIKDAFGEFCHAGGEVLQGLVNRRAKEAELFLNPTDMYSLYSDVADSSWYYFAVKFVSEKGLLVGTSSSKFEPSTVMTRAMAAVSLAKLADANIYDYLSGPFADVKDGTWYSNAVNWAYANGYMVGDNEGGFYPTLKIIRQDFLLVLYNYAVSRNYIADNKNDIVMGFPDSSSVSQYAQHAVAWAAKDGLISGDENGMIQPKKQITRAEVSQILMRFFEIYVD